MWIYTKFENFGPFCGEKRRKRGILSEIYNADFEGSLIRDLHFFSSIFQQTFDHQSKADEVDLVFKNNGLRFSFGFELELNFLPGLPGANAMCSFRSIRTSNIYFAEKVSNLYSSAFSKQKIMFIQVI